jgi:hypothetical protein
VSEDDNVYAEEEGERPVGERARPPRRKEKEIIMIIILKKGLADLQTRVLYSEKRSTIGSSTSRQNGRLTVSSKCSRNETVWRSCSSVLWTWQVARRVPTLLVRDASVGLEWIDVLSADLRDS